MKKQKFKKFLNAVVYALVFAGAINWGLSAFNFNLVSLIFGSYANWVYYAVGLSGVFAVYDYF